MEPTTEQLNARNAAVGAAATSTGVYTPNPGNNNTSSNTNAVDPGGNRVYIADPSNNKNGGFTYDDPQFNPRTPAAPRVNPDTIGSSGNTNTALPSFEEFQSSTDLSPDQKAAIADRYTKMAQATTDSINSQYGEKVAKQQEYNTTQVARARALNANTGNVDSGTGSARELTTVAKGNDVVAKIRNEQSTAIQVALGKIDALQLKDEQAQAAEKTKDLTAYNDLTRQSYKDAGDSVKTLASAGVTFDQLKTKDPTSYNTLLGKYGGDENLMKAAFVMNQPKETILAKHQTGNQLYVVTTDKNGNTETQTIDLPFSNAEDYKSPIHDGDNLLFMPKNFVPDPNNPKSYSQQLKDASFLMPLLPTSKQKKTSSGEVKDGKATFTGDEISGTRNNFESGRGSDGYTNTAQYVNAYKYWIKAGGSITGFKKQFPPNSYLNPKDPTVPAYLKPTGSTKVAPPAPSFGANK